MSSIHDKYRLKPVINASGRMTILGVSTPAPAVMDAARQGMAHYFEMPDLVDKTGDHLAGLLGAEAATVVSCASAGIALSVAAVIVRDDPDLLVNLHAKPASGPDEIVLAKGHNVNYGAPVATMVALGGGKVVEAGWANECTPAQLDAAVTARTAAILYIQSHHAVQKSMPTVEEAVAVARARGVPLIVDAAAEEDLRLYYRLGADLVIYSGAKAMEGPSSGLVLGRRQHVEWVKLQGKGIGRAMKIGKEGILGLTAAVEHYLSTPKAGGTEMARRLEPLLARLNRLPGIRAQVAWDSAGRDIARAEVAFDPSAAGLDAAAAAKRLKAGNPAVYCREYHANEGRLEFDIRSVDDAQLATLGHCIETLLKEN
ncbi:DgaE family pyridoxal phosphate-dependent ammonia lyase [Chromobacterium alticapitis]|uniref:DgaE family pyridoxal phosphate-dependent ammonia lyase n=1 Tax=Chromobacterium alticapitis TaxID=2073169 RepID=A0A2S5DD36_9NEIS|nr:DgaE family pyridoxal phosphate-dependent ammonia lyase [Chromobacterium alticapitis]POZ60964.1 DgaE family pyridoxal phosphate-dependent ammonia lyase [Chromobacterium alticapitis]